MLLRLHESGGRMKADGEQQHPAKHARHEAGQKLRPERLRNRTTCHGSLERGCAEADCWRERNTGPNGECEKTGALRETREQDHRQGRGEGHLPSSCGSAVVVMTTTPRMPATQRRSPRRRLGTAAASVIVIVGVERHNAALHARAFRTSPARVCWACLLTVATGLPYQTGLDARSRCPPRTSRHRLLFRSMSRIDSFPNPQVVLRISAQGSARLPTRSRSLLRSDFS